MATPSEIRNETLKALRLAQRQLDSPEWILAIEEESPAIQREAALQRLNIQRTRIALENETLTQIRDGLVENERALETGRASLERSLRSLDRVKTVLESVTAFVGAIEKVLEGLR